jgi:ATP-dependent RNA helicase DDX3X
MDIHEILKSNIELSGYNQPTPVQRHGLPIALAGRDIMACAQTGSGKTAAFLFPVIQMMLRTECHLKGGAGGRSRAARPSVLVLAPTRELATQIFNEARKFVYRSVFFSTRMQSNPCICRQQ